MAKGKPAKTKTAAHNHLRARIAYLHQSSSYLASAQPNQSGDPSVAGDLNREGQEEDVSKPSTEQSAQCRYLLTQLRNVSLKSQIRLTPEMKHSFCKHCASFLVPGSASTESIENKSRGGRKSWADVRVNKCNFCGTVKRFPIGMKKAKKQEDVPGGGTRKHELSKEKKKREAG